MAELTKRDQVKECIDKGNLTKVKIMESLGMSAGSVSTQMTYLRWMGNFIITDPDTKILSFTDEETYNALEAVKKVNRKTKSTSSRTPEERAVAVVKTIINQAAALVKWRAKVDSTQEMAEAHPEDDDAVLNAKEAVAMVAITEVKLARNETLAAELPDVPEASDQDVDTKETPADELL